MPTLSVRSCIGRKVLELVATAYLDEEKARCFWDAHNFKEEMCYFIDAAGKPKDVDREFVCLFMLFDENVSWYLDENGRNSTIWPGPTWRYRERMRRFEPGEYHLYPRTAAARAATAESPIAV